MEKEKQLVALTELKSHLTKQEIISVIVIAIIVGPIFYWTCFTQNNLFCRLLGINCILLGLYGIGVCVHNIIKLRKNTFFQIRRDILLDKRDDVYNFLLKTRMHRFLFQKGHYDFQVYSSLSAGSSWNTLYNMDMKTVYDTAFIDDSFTLVCHRKKVLFAFNDKLFEIENDL